MLRLLVCLSRRRELQNEKFHMKIQWFSDFMIILVYFCERYQQCFTANAGFKISKANNFCHNLPTQPQNVFSFSNFNHDLNCFVYFSRVEKNTMLLVICSNSIFHVVIRKLFKISRHKVNF